MAFDDIGHAALAEWLICCKKEQPGEGSVQLKVTLHLITYCVRCSSQ